MDRINIITPVKDSIELTLKTIESITASQISVPYSYTIYNDFSTPENCKKLESAARKYGFKLIHLSDITQNPSPNYRLVLQIEQKKAIAENAALCIVESDVIVKPNTLQSLFDETLKRTDTGMAAAVTVDPEGKVNYPYEYAKEEMNKIYATEEVFSFCCTLITPALLKAYDFEQFDKSKTWYDAVLTRISNSLGFKNYLFTNLPVIHSPHGSRPWRTLREKNILKYYFLKLLGRHKKVSSPNG
ncbi:glycosyltransferase family 2 protein [Bacteroides sp. OttesenSCG-928-F21]|nr:glycosyltransferase family 2 protein [Bacteroides sp. OttesenSCG-928-F21]